jgi:UDP-N-acetylmuramoyl-tripeptide--D-alanyl-D-alanine ligase
MAELRLSVARSLAALRDAGIAARLEGDAAASYSGAATDSRKVAPGDLFVALPGDRVDGHDYLPQALRAGASCLLVAEASWAARREQVLPALAPAECAGIAGTAGAAVLVVPSTLPAFQVLATLRRLMVPSMRRIGITGSSGKTTTKEIAASILSQGRKVAMNPGNLNSDIGLSQSMFGISADAEIGVFEMGMNRAGEMGELAGIYEPDIALITNVGTAHIGILGSRDAIALEKKAIFSRFSGSQLGFVNEADDYNAFLREGVRGEVRDFGPRSTKGFRGSEDLGLDGFAVDWEGLRVRFPLVGKHNLANAIAAMALAECVGTPPQEVAAGLEAVRPLFGRSEILRGEVTVIRDCYNANPDSAEAAIEFCDALEWRGRRVYVVGSMLELGAESGSAHRRVGAACAASKASALFFFGEEARPAFEAAMEAGFSGLVFFESDFDRLAAAAKAYVREGDLVLLKASRGMALERLAEVLR